MTRASRKAAKRLATKARPAVDNQPGGTTFPIVGVGASAGGLEAFTELLKALPLDTGMAFVVIQHLEAEHESMLTELLSKVTAMPVTEVRQKILVEPNHVYVIPANADLSLAEGAIRVSTRKAAAGRHLPIDHFFRTLAEAQGHLAIGVILSGTASDGTLGLKAIKAAGGITFAQEPKSAKFDGMPKSALLAGCVDFVLTPERIARELAQITFHPRTGLSDNDKGEPLVPAWDEDWMRIFRLLREASGVDFTFYKKPTISRRIARRMALKNVDRLSEYLKELQSHREELDALYRDLLIQVTSFFRDTDVFRVLRNRILPQILKRKPAGDSIRVWVPGCSSGEEAYSIAICLLENLGDRAASTPIQIFASDINEQAVDKARAGVYPKEALKKVTRERVRRFFSAVNRHYQIKSGVRDLCIFARHDLTKDPPFSRMDLISCRNVLIYLEPLLQKRILESFRYALRDGGFLLLGKSERLGGFPDFKVLDGKNKFFAKVALTPAGETGPVAFEKPAYRGKHYVEDAPGFDLEKEADRVIWERSLYAGIVVNGDLEILHFRGDTSPYLRPAPGKATFQLLRMVREELVLDLRGAIDKARKTGASVKKEAIRVKHNGDVHLVNIEVRPLAARRAGDRYFLIVFEDVLSSGSRLTEGETKPAAGNRVKEGRDRELAELKNDLTRTRDYLQAIIQEHETTNEELKAANEEAQSSMEELNSTNEELETAKEELQSTNEELTTLNEQLQKRNTELAHLSDELSNVLTGVDIPILILGGDLRIRRFTPLAEKLLRLLPGDIGRPVSHIRMGVTLPDLEESIAQINKGVRDVWREVRAEDGRWYSVRILPFITAERKIDGALMVFVDVNDLKLSHETSKREQKLIAAVLNAARDLLVVVLDGEGRVLQFNSAAQELTGYSLEDVKGKLLWDFLPAPEERAEVRAGVQDALKGGNAHGETHWLTKRGQRRLIAWSNTVAVREGGTIDYVIRTGVDVTEREEAQEQVRDSDAAVRTLLETAPEAVLANDAEGKILFVNAAAEALFGYERKELIGQPLAILIPERFRKRHAGHVANFFRKPGMRPMARRELRALRKDGSEFPADIGLSYFKTKTGMLGVSFVSDITERKKNEAVLLQNQKELQALTARLLKLQEAGNKELARELHDDLSQKLAALGMEVSTLLQRSGPSDSLPERIRALSARINGLAEGVHALSRRLHPAVLDELGLEAAIREECAAFSAQAPLSCEIESRGIPNSLPEDVALCLYRVAQESLRNIAKHARAGSVRVVLTGKKDGVSLRVEDSGDGFDLKDARGKGGLGLISMEERVRLLDGKFTIQSHQGKGTTVDVFVPLARKRGAGAARMESRDRKGK